MGMNTAAVQRLYVAYFNRPADPVSLAVYEAMLPTDREATQAELAVVAETYFSPSAEYTTNFEGKSNSQVVDQLYQNIFGREAEAAGLISWATKLTDGSITVAELALQLSYSAQGTDATVVAARIEAATAFTDALDTASEINGYSGNDAAAEGRTYLAQISGGTDTTDAAITAQKDAAVAGVDSSVTAAVDASSASGNLTFTLTAASAGDDFAGGSGDDTFTASNSARYQDADVLDGGAGTDTLTAKLNSTTAHDAFVNDIEVINFDVLGTSTILANQITGATNVNLTGGSVLTMTNAEGGIAYSVAEAGTGLTLVQNTTDSSTDAVTVTLGTGALGTLTLGDDSGTDFETFNLIVDGTTSTTLTEDNAAAITGTGESVVITGESTAFELNLTDAALGGNTTASSATTATIDASGFTGELTLDIGVMETENVDASDFSGVDVIKIETDDTGGDDNQLIDVASGTVVEIAGTEAVDNTLTVDPDGSGTSDTLTVKLNHATDGSSIDITGLTTDGFETLTIESTGTNTSAATVSNVIDDVAGLSTDTKLLLTGDKALTLTGVENTFTTITSTNTAGVTVDVDASSTLTFTGGSGNDTLEVANIGDITTADTLVGGDGTDTLIVTDTANAMEDDAISATVGARITGFEVLAYQGAQDLTNTADSGETLDLRNLAGVHTLKFEGALEIDATDTLTVNAPDNFTLIFDAAMTNATAADMVILVTNAANAGTDNSVTLALEGDAAGAATSVDGFTIDNVENLAIQVKGEFQTSDVITIDDIDGAQLQDITISETHGDADENAESLTITDVESTLIRTIDASAYDGTLDVTGLNDNLIATGATVTGGSGADSITGGAGADVILGNGGGDTLVGGNGADAITAGEGTDSVTGGLGADTITVTESTAAIDTVIMTTGGAIAVDTVVGFDVNNAAELGDNVDIDLSDINGIVTDLRTGDGTVAATAGAPTLTTVSEAHDMGDANSDILVLSGDFDDTDEVETALEAGGSRALTSDDAGGNYAADDAFLILYDDGDDSYLAMFQFGTDPGDDATFASGDLTVTNLLKFTGIADATTFVSNNFDIIA